MKSRRSFIVAKLLAFIYYSEYRFEDFVVGNTADPSDLWMDGDIVPNPGNFKIAKVEKSDAASEVINYFLDLGCIGISGHTETDKGYVYVCLKTNCKNPRDT